MMLNNAVNLNDLRVPPGNRLEALSSDRRGQHSIRINDQWRICFVWSEGDAYQVEIWITIDGELESERGCYDKDDGA